MNFLKTAADGIGYYAKRFGMWILIACGIGLVCGLVGSLFSMAVGFANSFRGDHHYLIFALPAAGALIALIYKKTGMEGKGTNEIIDSIHFGDKVPLMLTPVIFLSTFITHLVGGSAGREGAALQIGGSIGCRIGRWLKLDDRDMRLVTLCGMSAVFSALFGTPLTASLFAMEVISVGILHYSGLVPCVVASSVAYGVSLLMGLEPEHYVIVTQALSAKMFLKVMVLAVVCAGVSIVFCLVMHGTAHLASKKLKNSYLRAAVGGLIILALTLIMQTDDYNGAGAAVISAAIEEGRAAPLAFFWKLLFTAITIGCGFKGGEIVPTFFVGATLGCVLGPLLGLPAGFAAAVGLIALFCGNVNCPITSIILSVELFGSGNIIYFAVACGIAYMLSGYFGLYSSQKIMYSKTKAEFINRNAE